MQTPMVDGRTARSRETHVLRIAARPGLTPEQRAALGALTTPPFDWSRMFGLAQAHGLGPLVFTHLTAARAMVPGELAENLSRRVAETAALNLSLVAQLAAVLDRLRAHDIPAVGLKGPFLAEAYGHLGLRPFGDLDVLIPRSSGPQARRVMHAQGYQDVDQYSIIDGVYPPAGREYVFVPERPGGVAVEVQVDVSDWTLPVALPADELIARGITTTVAGVRLPTLAHEDHLLVLALHGVRHAWTSLRHVSDVHAAASMPLDWSIVRSRAEAARMTRMLHIGLLLSHTVLETPLPADVLADARRDRAAGRTAREIERRMFTSPSPRQLRRWRTRVALRSRSHPADRARFIGRTIAFERIIRPLDEWRAVRGQAAAWRTAKIARRLALPMLALAAYVASRTARPLVVGLALAATLGVLYAAIHVWASRRPPVRTWSNRHA